MTFILTYGHSFQMKLSFVEQKKRKCGNIEIIIILTVLYLKKCQIT